MKTTWNDWRTTWAVLSAPAAVLGVTWLAGAVDGAGVIHSSGELSARLLVVILALTPFHHLFPKHRWPRWLLARRRPMGVASFVYATIHVATYGWKHGVFTDWRTPSLLAAWLAFGVFTVLATTSNTTSMRLLGTWWKPVQRGAYLAALATAAHWALLKGGVFPAAVHFVPLLLLQFARLRPTR